MGTSVGSQNNGSTSLLSKVTQKSLFVDKHKYFIWLQFWYNCTIIAKNWDISPLNLWETKSLRICLKILWHHFLVKRDFSSVNTFFKSFENLLKIFQKKIKWREEKWWEIERRGREEILQNIYLLRYKHFFLQRLCLFMYWPTLRVFDIFSHLSNNIILLRLTLTVLFPTCRTPLSI